VYGSSVELVKRLLDTTVRILATAIAAAAAVLAWRFQADTALALGTPPIPVKGETEPIHKRFLAEVYEEGSDFVSSVAGVLHLRRSTQEQKEQQVPAAAAAVKAAATGSAFKGTGAAEAPKRPVVGGLEGGSLASTRCLSRWQVVIAGALNGDT
jgi:hypothetical protein